VREFFDFSLKSKFWQPIKVLTAEGTEVGNSKQVKLRKTIWS